MNHMKLSTLRAAIKAVNPEARVSRPDEDWFVIRTPNGLAKILAALPGLGLREAAPREIEGGRHDWIHVIHVEVV